MRDLRDMLAMLTRLDPASQNPPAATIGAIVHESVHSKPKTKNQKNAVPLSHFRTLNPEPKTRYCRIRLGSDCGSN